MGRGFWIYAFIFWTGFNLTQFVFTGAVIPGALALLSAAFLTSAVREQIALRGIA